MTPAVDFYFDFSSPYSYLASSRIEQVLGTLGAEIRWRPFLLGAVFKVTGGRPLTSQPMKGDYMLLDVARVARRYDIPFIMPAVFPFGTVTSARAFYAIEETDPAGAVRLAKALFHAAFGQGRDICPVEAVAAIASESGFDGDAVLEGMNSAPVKQRLKYEVDKAIEHQIFGAPFFLVDGEAFWGSDRLEQVASWIESGGW